MLIPGRPWPLCASRYRARAGGLICAVLLLPGPALSQPRVGNAEPLEEIIVTARKLPEDISRVPMSVQTLSGDFLDSRGLSNFYDLQFDVPGLVVNNRGMFGGGLALRGVTDEGGGNLAVAPHFNGVYLGRSNLALARMFDIERVEVVKGPQGTLYGRNATGGAINVITRAPEDKFDARVEAALGSFNTVRVQGHLNIAAEKLATRIAVVGSEGDGYIRNSVDGRRFAEQDYRGIRGSLRVRPTAALTIDVTAQHVEDDGASGELWLPRRDQLPDPGDIRLTSVTHDDPYLTTEDDFGVVNIAYDLDRKTLRSITGYARNVTRALDDCAGFPLLQGCVRGVAPLRYEERSQEVRLESAANPSIEWLIGAYYYNSDEFEQFHQTIPGIAPVPLNDSMANSDTTAYAVFSDVTRALAERWSLIGGLRFSREYRRVASVGNGLTDNPTLRSAHDSWDDTSWRLGFEYLPAEQTLVYATVSTGFKSGGVTTRRLPNGEFDGYDAEGLLAYEAGISTTLQRQRAALRVSAFDYYFEDMQVHTVAVLSTGVTAVVDNAAAARIYGLDVSAQKRVSDRLTFSGALVWMPKREFVEFIDPSNGNALTGNTISRAPEWSMTSTIGYRVPIAGIGELSINADYNYRTEFYFTKENDSILGQGDFGLLDLILRFDSSAGRWYAFATARNLLDTDYFIQAFIQSSPGYPANYEAGFGLQF